MSPAAEAFEKSIPVVEPAGFKLQRLVELPPYHYGTVFERCKNGKSEG